VTTVAGVTTPRVFSVVPGNVELTLRNWALLLNTFVLPATNPARTFTDADTTPSVLGSCSWVFANTGATSVTDFDDGFAGQVIAVLLDANTTLVHNAAKIYTNTAANIVGAAGMAVAFMYGDDGVWYELGR
jgi:hypothetical protein